MQNNFLIEVSPVKPNGTVTTLRMSRRGVSSAGVYLDNKQWLPLLETLPAFSLNLMSNGQLQNVAITYGDLAFICSDAYKNEEWSSYDWSNALASCWYGEDGAPFSEYEQVFSGRVSGFNRQEIYATVSLLGSEADLQRQALYETYAGTGGLEGSAALKGNLKPRLHGFCENVTPVLIDSVYMVYQVHGYGPISGFTKVYDFAQALPPSKGNATTYNQLIGLALQPGEWATCHAQGLMRIGGVPTKLTCDVQGALYNGTYTNTVKTIVQQLIREVQPSATFGTFGAFADAEWCFYSNESQTVADIVYRAVYEAGGYILPDGAGRWQVGDFYAPINRGQLRSDRSQLPLVIDHEETTSTGPVWKVSVGHSRNWTVHNTNEISPAVLDLSGYVTEDAFSDYIEEFEQTQSDVILQLDRLDAMASDGILDRAEKKYWVQQHAAETADYNKLIADSAAWDVGTADDTYTARFTALNQHLNSLSPAWNDGTKDTPVTRSTFRAAWEAVYAAKMSLTLALAEAAKWDKIIGPGKPQDGATVGAPSGTTVGGIAAETIASGHTTITALVSFVPEQVVLTAASITSRLDTAQNVKMSIKWSPIIGCPTYDLEIRDTGSTAWSSVQVGDTAMWTGDVVANASYQARVRAVSKTGTAGPWSAIITHVAIKDTAPPAIPSGFTAVGVFGAFNLNWTNPADADLVRIDVYSNSTNASASATLAASVPVEAGTKGYFRLSETTAGVTRWFWLKAVDGSGNASAFSAVATATTVKIEAPDLGSVPGENITGSIAASIDAGKIISGTLPADRIDTVSAAKITTGTVLPGGVLVGATAVSTILSNAASGATAATGTTNYRTTGVPTNNPVPAGVYITANSNGTRNIQLNWNQYTQGARQADLLMVFWRRTNSTITTNDPSVAMNVNTTSNSNYVFEGVSPADVMHFGIAAARRTETGLEIGPIQTHATWTNVAAATPNYTANINGQSAATLTQAIADISNDAILSRTEKPDVVREYQRVVANDASLGTQATAMGLSTTALDSAFAALTTYLNGLSPAYTDFTQQTAIVPATFNARFGAYYTAEANLTAAIAAKAATLSTWAGVDGIGKPQDFAGLPDMNLALDGNFTMTAAGQSFWATHANAVVQPTIGQNGLPGARLIAYGGVNDMGSRYRIPVKQGDRFFVTACVRVSADMNGQFNLGTTVLSASNAALEYPAIGFATIARDTWTTISGVITISQAAAVTMMLRPSVRNDATAGYMDLSWIVVSRAEIGATKNATTYATAAPSGPTNGDIWVDTSVNPNITKLYASGAWRNAATNTTDTNQLTDGAGLGNTATWTGVSGAAKPADYANAGSTAQNANVLFGNTAFDLVDGSGRPAGIRALNSGNGIDDTLAGWVGGEARGDLRIGVGASGAVTAATPMWRVNTKSRYRARIRVKASAAVTTGFHLRAWEYDGEPGAGVTHILRVNSDATSVVMTRELTAPASSVLTAGAGAIENANLTTAYQDAVIEWTPTSTAKFTALSFHKGSGAGTSDIHIQSCVIEEIQPSTLAELDSAANTNLTDTSAGTAKYRVSGVPTNNPTATSCTVGANTNGTRNIYLYWNTYTQGARQADFLLVFWKRGATAPTVNDSSVTVNVNTSGTSYYIFEGVNPAEVISYGIAAARRTENGIEIGAIQTRASWTNISAATPNFTANLNGTSAATVVTNAATGAQDPATRINAAATTIDPGKIVISGATTLANWRNGSDTTKIEGGWIATDTITAAQIKAGAITANKLAIGAQTLDSIVVKSHSNNVTDGVVAGVYVNGVNQAAGPSIGHTVVVFNRATHAFISKTTYNTYSGTAAIRQSMVDALNALTNQHLVCILTFDAVGWTPEIVAALKGIGASNALDSVTPLNQRQPYALIGSPDIGEGNGMEHLQPTLSTTHAETSTLWIDSQIMGASSSISALTRLNSTYIADGAIITGKIATGAIASDKIAANAVTAVKIDALAVTSDKIAALAVSADKIAANAVTAIKIAAGTITADKIAAGSITARELAIADLTNLIPGGDLITTDSLPTGSRVNWAADATNAYAGKPYVLVMSAAAAASWQALPNSQFTVEAGDQLYFECWMKVTSDLVGSGGIQIRYDTPTGAQTGTFSLNVNSTHTAYTKISGTSTVPANSTVGRIQYYGANTAGTIYIGQQRLLRKNAGNLIVDGAITTNSLAANAVTTAKLAVDAVTANEIKAGAVTTEAMTANTIDGSVITAGTLSADKIKAGTVLAGTVTVSGTALSTVTTNAASGATAATGTSQYRSNGVPTNNPVGTAASVVTNTNGSRNITLNWNAYTQGTLKADFLMVFWRRNTTTPTVNDTSVTLNVNTSGASYYVFEGLSPTDAMSFGIAAARRTENGIEIGAIQTHASWTNVTAATPNYTANINGTTAATVVTNAATGAQDPAARINAASTTIDPGKILISGATTLANWRNGSDTTKIEGGSIATNTITANSIQANAITASKMTLMSMDDINPDAGMFDRAFWAWGTEGTISAMDGSGAAQPRRFAQVTNTAGRNVDVVTQPIAMEVGATYKITFRVWLSSDFAGWLGCTMHMPGQQWHTPAPNSTNSAVDSGGYPLIQSGNLNGVPKNQWVEYTSQFTFQANATGAFTQFRTRYALTAGSAQFAWQVSRAMDAKLIVDGSITARKLTIGFGGNMIHGGGLNVNPNTFMNIDDDRSGQDFEKNGRGEWLLGSTQYAFGLGYNSDGYNLPDKSVWSLRQVNSYNGGAGSSDCYFTRPMNATGGAAREFDVEPGRTYEFSIYTGTHRCNAEIYMQVLDGAWTHLSWTASTAESRNFQQGGGGTNLQDFRRVFVRVAMPSNARFVRLMVRKYRTLSGNSDSYLFMAKPVFAETSPNATTLMNWSPPSQSIIDGAGIRTGTITADRMSVGSLDAITANIGTLRTASSGQRVEISSNVIKVYDASNVLRVRLGDLNG